jgi:hypothetical protein
MPPTDAAYPKPPESPNENLVNSVCTLCHDGWVMVQQGNRIAFHRCLRRLPKQKVPSKFPKAEVPPESWKMAAAGDAS